MRVLLAALLSLLLTLPAWALVQDDLQWTQTTPAPDNFQVVRCAAGAGTATCAPTVDLAGALVAGSQTDYHDTTKVAGTDYCYTVVAIVGGVRSTPSNTVCLPDIVTGLVAYYPLDTGSGTTATDDSTYHNHGTLVNGPTWTTGQYGQAVSLAAGTQRIQIPAATQINNLAPVTFAAWVKITSTVTNAFARITDKGAVDNIGWVLMVLGTTNQRLKWTLNDGGPGISQTFADTTLGVGTWHHLVATSTGSVSASGLAVYLDSVLLTPLATTDGSGPLPSDASYNLLIGNSPGGTQGINMVIDEIRVYNRALSQYDATLLFQTAPAAVPTLAPPTAFRLLLK